MPRTSENFRPPRKASKSPRSPSRPAGKPPLRIQPTTLWDYPSQNYGTGHQGDENYPGVTPSYVIWNLIQRYTSEGELVVDPFCGSGTTLDVARDTNREARGFDLAPTRPQIERADARDLPVKPDSADLVFMDPPYSTHIDYSDDPDCIGKLDSSEAAYFEAMDRVFAEAMRLLKPGRVLGVYVSDSYVHKGQNKGFWPIGFELFGFLLRRGFEPVDIVAVTRHNKTLEMGNYRMAAEKENFFLRGFNYLLIVRKPEAPVRHLRKKKTCSGSRKKRADPL